MERVETDLNKSKQAREKQSREFSKQIEEERNQHERKVFITENPFPLNSMLLRTSIRNYYSYKKEVFSLTLEFIQKILLSKGYLIYGTCIWNIGKLCEMHIWLCFIDSGTEDGLGAWESPDVEGLPYTEGDCYIWAWERDGQPQRNSPEWAVWAQVSNSGETRQRHQG